ncbi:hypothetical protein AGRO_4824 [Agrobacterium sp. ATCC 31749]|nr:hypothetical protein AGRO_4824 [Agrobacterium sp. ATCC 31749]
MHRDYLHDVADTASAVRPGDVNRIFLTGRYPASRLALRGTDVWIFPASEMARNGSDSLYIKFRAVRFNRARRQLSRFFCDGDLSASFRFGIWKDDEWQAGPRESEGSVQGWNSFRHNSAFVTPDGLPLASADCLITGRRA